MFTGAEKLWPIFEEVRKGGYMPFLLLVRSTLANNEAKRTKEQLPAQHPVRNKPLHCCRGNQEEIVSFSVG